MGIYVNKFGTNTDVDAAEDIWDGGGTYAWPSAAAATTIVSSSTDDDGDPAGTGAQTVKVYGLDSNWLMISETVTMNGTGAVTLENQYLRVFRAHTVAVGSGAVNAGNIQVKHGATVLAQITAGKGQTLMALYTIPADFAQAEIRKWYASIAVKISTGAEMELMTRTDGEGWRVREVFGITEANPGLWEPGTAGEGEPVRGIIVPPKTDVRVRAASVAAVNTVIASGYQIKLQEV